MKITPFRARWIGRLGALFLRVMGSTWRIRIHGYQPDLDNTDVVFAFQHGEMLMPAVLYRRIPAAIMISQHGDGEVIAQVVLRLGRHLPVRGSSTRGGARAFLEMVKEQGELPWAITPDGPKGPRGSVQDGAILLAAESGRPLVLGVYAIDRAWRARSWDRFAVPKPFARIAGILTQPISVPPGLDPEQRKRLAAELEQEFVRAHEAAERALASW